MNQSETIKELASALALAQAEMGGAVKDSANPFFKSSYADLTSVIKVLKEPFAKHGLSYVQMPVTSAGGQGVGVSTMLMHKSGEWVQQEYLLPMDKITPQGAGSAITYARRYALQAMAGIPAVDDDAEAAMLRNEPTLPDGVSTAPPKRARKALVQKLLVLISTSQSSGETSELKEALDELANFEKEAVWSQLTTSQKTFMREIRGM